MLDLPRDLDRSERTDDARPPGLAVTAAVVLGVAVLAAAQLAALVASGTAAAMLAVDVVAAVVGLAVLPVLLRRPVHGALVLSLLAVVSPAATPAASAGAFHVAQSARLRVSVGVAALGAGAHVVREWWRPIEALPFAWWVFLVVIAYATLVGWGRYAQARRALLSSLCERARRAESEQAHRVTEAREAERTRIAREMHDVLAHRLSLLATYAGALEYRPDASPERLSAAAGVVRAGVHEALDELRDVITLLRDEDAHGDRDGDLRPQPTLLDLPRLVEESRAVGTRVQLDTSCDLSALPLTAGRTAYRVIQEALTNARRHAPGRPVYLALQGRRGAHLDIEIRNSLTDQAGASTDGTGTGIVGLTERVQLQGGALTWDRSDSEFRLHARLPWPDEPDAQPGA